MFGYEIHISIIIMITYAIIAFTFFLIYFFKNLLRYKKESSTPIIDSEIIIDYFLEASFVGCCWPILVLVCIPSWFYGRFISKIFNFILRKILKCFGLQLKEDVQREYI